MKIEWINNGKNFDIPKINIDVDIEILEYMETLPADILNATTGIKFQKKFILEYKETVYKILNQIDKNVTKEMIMKNLTTNELGALYIAIRLHGRVKCVCPHCKKQFLYDEMPQPEGDIPLPENKPSDITETKKQI